ncbi:MAG TPA: hypothetical protein VE990_11565 [Acidimicrobiales bacterium]|nr:hypothetical protein [Acidimicrobiales bacterium]
MTVTVIVCAVVGLFITNVVADGMFPLLSVLVEGPVVTLPAETVAVRPELAAKCDPAIVTVSTVAF